ncbi:MAG: zinc ribbon domain-containing protein [Terracidiphilus sp.]|nr:zinc ribbon domain-containing protein [Terracidiphilus sp.]MDR3796585.1 zinc ribbon domain-containing protein [Terracidiphilus sp.]
MSNCAKCGQPLKEDAGYCGQCGAPANQVAPDYGAGVSPPPAPISYPVAAQAPGTLGYVRLTLGEISFFFGQITITILVDGNAVRTIQMNETVDFVVPVGRHLIELVQVYHSAATLNVPITRKSDLELNVVTGTLTVVTGTYSTFFGKFSLDLA